MYITNNVSLKFLKLFILHVRSVGNALKKNLLDTMHYYQPKNLTVNISIPPDPLNRPLTPVNRGASTMKKTHTPVNRSVSTNMFDYNGLWITPLGYKFLPTPSITLKRMYELINCTGTYDQL